MMVASRLAMFSLSSDGLRTTAFPAEHMESGGPHPTLCPPSDAAQGLPPSSALWEGGQESWGTATAPAPQARSSVRCENTRRSKGREVSGPSRASPLV